MVKIEKNIELSSLTTFRIGGPAKFYAEVNSKDDLTDVFRWTEENNEKSAVLAGGSNVLVGDSGFDGVVIALKNRDCVILGDRMECGAGAFLSLAVSNATSNQKTGLEWAIGIPGSVGGAVNGNAGAFGVDMSSVVETVEVYNVRKKIFEVFSKKDCAFSYRNSIFKGDGNFIIWNITLRLADDVDRKAQELMSSYVLRRSKGQPKLPSAGCVFKNIIVSDIGSENRALLEMIRTEGVEKGGKIGAGWLIDKIGLGGKKIGGAKVSLEHANFIVNTGGATAQDVVMLISYIKQQVRDRFGIQLQEEIVYFGF